MEFKMRNNTVKSFQCLEALTDAIKQADELASRIEQSKYQAKEAFDNAKIETKCTDLK